MSLYRQKVLTLAKDFKDIIEEYRCLEAAEGIRPDFIKKVCAMVNEKGGAGVQIPVNFAMIKD